jgi:hypothetical protein
MVGLQLRALETLRKLLDSPNAPVQLGAARTLVSEVMTWHRGLDQVEETEELKAMVEKLGKDLRKETRDTIGVAAWAARPEREECPQQKKPRRVSTRRGSSLWRHLHLFLPPRFAVLHRQNRMGTEPRRRGICKPDSPRRPFSV